VDNGDEAKLGTYLDKNAGRWPVSMAMEIAQVAVKCSEMRRKKRPDLETEVMPVLDKARAAAVKAEEDAKRAPAARALAQGRCAHRSLFCPITQVRRAAPLLPRHFIIFAPHLYVVQELTVSPVMALSLFCTDTALTVQY